MLPVSPWPFHCQALGSCGLSGAGVMLWRFFPSSPLASFGSGAIALLLEGFCSCATVPLFERLPFPTARPFGWLCLRGWFLVDALGFPSLWMPSFVFSVAAPSRLVLGCLWVMVGWVAARLVRGVAAADSRARFFI